jgi:hypothetical protein
MPDEKPTEKVTTQLPAVPEWAVELTRTTKDGFRAVRADLELVANDLSLVKERVTIIETWRNDQDQRLNRNSNRVRDLADTTSHVDLTVQAVKSEAIVKQMEQDRKIAETHTMVEAVKAETAQQTAILARLDKVASNPLVKTVATALGTAILTWLASKGLR